MEDRLKNNVKDRERIDILETQLNVLKKLNKNCFSHNWQLKSKPHITAIPGGYIYNNNKKNKVCVKTSAVVQKKCS